MKSFAFTLLFLAVVHFSLPLAMAHELLPKEILEILQNDPDLQSEAARQLIDEHAKNGTLQEQQQVQELFELRDLSTTDGFWTSFSRFIVLGIEHILEGVDHILFLLSLLLVFVNLRGIIVLVSAFTVSHSVTLILAGSSVLSLSSTIVEPLIAGSIVIVAMGSVFFSQSSWWKGQKKVWIVFFFGLFHGLGFAGLLEGLQIPDDRFISSLLAFNIGIELGQIFVLMLVLPWVYLFRKKAWYPVFIRILALLISSVALYWFIERVFL